MIKTFRKNVFTILLRYLQKKKGKNFEKQIKEKSAERKENEKSRNIIKIFFLVENEKQIERKKGKKKTRMMSIVSLINIVNV